MNVLVVEDEPALADSICTYLAGEHFQCDRAADFEEARAKLTATEYACILLDVGLPGGSGLELLKLLKEAGKQDGVLIISAKASLDDRVSGLRLGADDYLAKPFHLPELSARVDAIIRRRAFSGAAILRFDALVVNPQAKTVHVGQTPVELTRKEYEMLLYFLANQTRVVSKPALASHLWPVPGMGSDSYDLIYTHVRNLRRKLLAAGSPDYIQAVYGMGYKFRIP